MTAPPRTVVVGLGPLANGLADGLRDAHHTVASSPVTEVSRAAFAGQLHALAASMGGGIDLVVHTWVHPAALVARDLADTTDAEWHDACRSTLDAAYRLAQAAHPLLTASRGRLVYVVPTVALSGASGYSALAAATEGIRVLAKGIAKNWGAAGVTVHCLAVAPALVLAGARAVDGPGGEGSLGTELSLAPPALGRRGDPATDLAPIIGLLTGPGAHFVTGETLTVDGGVWSAS